MTYDIYHISTNSIQILQKNIQRLLQSAAEPNNKCNFFDAKSWQDSIWGKTNQWNHNTPNWFAYYAEYFYYI